jgi:hypothetical protein
VSASKPFTGRFSAARTGLILFFILVAWLGFVAMPSRKEVAKRIAPEESALAVKLHAVGLPENPDYEGLPEIFAIWAGKAEWKDNKTKFAYWHPVMKTYSYYFEATRVESRFRFVEIAKPQDSAGYYLDDSLGDDCPVRFYYSVGSENLQVTHPAMGTVIDSIGRDAPVVKPDFEVPGIQVPKPELPSINSQPKQ